MASPLQEARQAVGAALAGLPVPVYTFPPENPEFPCVQISPAYSDWIRPRLDGTASVVLTLRVMNAVTGGNKDSLERLEDILWALLKVYPSSAGVAGPRMETIGQTEAYVAEIAVQVLVKEDSP